QQRVVPEVGVVRSVIVRRAVVVLMSGVVLLLSAVPLVGGILALGVLLRGVARVLLVFERGIDGQEGDHRGDVQHVLARVGGDRVVQSGLEAGIWSTRSALSIARTCLTESSRPCASAPGVERSVRAMRSPPIRSRRKARGYAE